MLKELFRYLTPATGIAAVVTWAIALQQAMPRLMAGPLCSTRQDTWVLAGHCPACYVAALLTVAFLASLLVAQRDSRRAAHAVLATQVVR